MTETPNALISATCPACGKPLTRFEAGRTVQHIPPGEWTVEQTIDIPRGTTFEGCTKGTSQLVGPPGGGWIA